MPKIKVDGLDDQIAMLNTLSKDSTGIIKAALYDASHITYKEVQAQINALHNISDVDRQGLLSSLYHSKMTENTGVVQEVIGFTGYNGRGAPNIVVARSINSGTSKLKKKHPFMRKSVNITKPAVVKKMQEVIDKKVAEMQKG